MAEGIERRMHDVRVGAERTLRRAQGHGRVSSIEALKAIIGMIAEQTGQPGYKFLVGDALRAEHARGALETVDHMQGARANDVSALAVRTSDLGEEPGYAAEAQEVARKSRLYQELAQTPLIVVTEEAMGETLETEAIAAHRESLAASLTARASAPVIGTHRTEDFV